MSEIEQLPIQPLDLWARVDLFGRTIVFGHLTTFNTGVEVLYRLEVPTEQGFQTKFLGKGAIYSIDPVSEEAAQLGAETHRASTPISAYDLPEAVREALRAAKAKQLAAQNAHPAGYEAAQHLGSIEREDPEADQYDDEDEADDDGLEDPEGDEA